MLPSTFTSFWNQQSSHQCSRCHRKITLDTLYGAHGFYCNEAINPKLYHRDCLPAIVQRREIRFLIGMLLFLIAALGLSLPPIWIL